MTWPPAAKAAWPSRSPAGVRGLGKPVEPAFATTHGTTFDSAIAQARQSGGKFPVGPRACRPSIGTFDRQWYSEMTVPGYANQKLVAPIQDQKVLGQSSIYRQR